MSKSNSKVQSLQKCFLFPGLHPNYGQTETIVYDVILVEWNSIGERFLNEVEFEEHPYVRVHLFFNKNKRHCNKLQKQTQKLSSNLILHESHTTSVEAPWIDLLVYLINFYTKATTLNSYSYSRIKYYVTLVTNNGGKYKEAEELLKSNKTNTLVVDGWSSTILDLFENVCRACKTVFRDIASAEKHDRKKHNFLCDNIFCERSQRCNGFYYLDELKKHMRKQKQCEHCPDKSFCNVEKYKEHMSEYHVLCQCPCARYYCNIDEFIEHYCTFHPARLTLLSCLEDTDCRARFKNIDEQSFHQKSKPP